MSVVAAVVDASATAPPALTNPLPVSAFSDVPEMLVAAFSAKEPLASSVSPGALPVIEDVSEVSRMSPTSPEIPVVFSVV